jgi:hypothetical protein
MAHSEMSPTKVPAKEQKQNILIILWQALCHNTHGELDGQIKFIFQTNH